MRGEDVKLQTKNINMVLAVSIVTLFFSVYGCVMFAFLHPLPHIVPSEIGDCIFVSDALPRNCRIIGLSVTSDHHIYLHAEHQTLCFDMNGRYSGRFVYDSQGDVYFRRSESDDSFWLYYTRSGDKYLYSAQGVVLQKNEMTDTDFANTPTYNKLVEDSAGNTYRVRNFLCFSSVTGPDGKLFYHQSVILITDYILIFVSAVLTVVFWLFQVKKKIGDESLIDWAIRGGFYSEGIDSVFKHQSQDDTHGRSP